MASFIAMHDQNVLSMHASCFFLVAVIMIL